MVRLSELGFKLLSGYIGSVYRSVPRRYHTMPYVVPGGQNRADLSLDAPLPGGPRCAHTPGSGSFTYAENENEPSTSAGDGPTSPPTMLAYSTHSTPLPCLALGRRRRHDAIPFPSDVFSDASNKSPLRLSIEAIKAAMAPEPARPTPTPTPSLRKKSGELVKPSLKHAHTVSGGLATQKSLSRSAPATPTLPKCVHFDSQLEHVRLFLAEQKPTAVSRDGSPTTSEGEEPWHDEERIRRSLRIKHTNLVASPIADADVKVESLVLSDDGSSLVGRVLVRNIAFEKWVAARFTFDWWQTTSEVSARYVDSPAEAIDRFSFAIKLGDVLHRIDEKTLFVAVRYSVAGREIWDSNNGQNYMVAFSKDKPKPKPKSSLWPKSQMSDLRKSLERVMHDDEDKMPRLHVKPRSRRSVRGMSFSGFDKPSVASIVDEKTKLAERYDFGAAPRVRHAADEFRMPELKDKSTRPTLSTDEPKLCSSPRDAQDALMRMAPVEPLVCSNGLDLACPPPRRHHHRASYFDAWSFPAPGVKRTVSGAPADDDADVPDLTASVTSASSPSESPSSPPVYMSLPELVAESKSIVSHPDPDPSNYSSFLDR